MVKLPETGNSTGNKRHPDLLARMVSRLPSAALDLIDRAALAADSRGKALFLVGGIVRDLLLDRPCLDIDLVLEGNAIDLAKDLQSPGLVLTTHLAFGTATLASQGFNIDFVSARREEYVRPGSLPLVGPGSIRDDLFRRDFSINAMALPLNGKERGQLLDPFGGHNDLKTGLIRILHPKSFIDDATRMLRAVRYEQRLGFRLEDDTAFLLKRDVSMLGTISGDRIRHELDRTFKEEEPERALERAGKLGVLSAIHPSIPGNGWLAETYPRARLLAKPSPVSLCYAVFLYRLGETEASDVLNRLSTPRAITQLVLDTIALKGLMNRISSPEIKPSQLYAELRDFSPQSILANLAAARDPVIERNLRLYLNKLRYIRPNLRGGDLIQLGTRPGPAIGELLSQLHRAKLDGEIRTKAQELKLARTLLEQKPPARPVRRKPRGQE